MFQWKVWILKQSVQVHLFCKTHSRVPKQRICSTIEWQCQTYGITDIDLTRLQHVQNLLTCLVTKSPPFSRNLPLLRSLQWLPARFRILFKFNLLIYKTLHETQPSLHACLSVPRVKTNTGVKSFSLLCPVSLEQPPAVCLLSHFSCYHDPRDQQTIPLPDLSDQDGSNAVCMEQR